MQSDEEIGQETPDVGLVARVSFTPQQDKFIENLVGGIPQGKSAELAGYAFPDQSGHYLVRQQHIQKEVRRRLEMRLLSEGAPLALNALVQIVQNEKAAPAARVSAANSLLDRAGIAALTARNVAFDPGAKDPSEMSVDELNAIVDALSAARARRNAAAGAEDAVIVREGE